jgi:hypothetical protein
MWDGPPGRPVFSFVHRRIEPMTRDQALARLHAALPREVAFNVQRTEWTHAKMDLVSERLVRADPAAHTLEEHWTVTLFWEIAGEEHYLEATRDASLERAVAESLRKFDAWRQKARGAEPVLPVEAEAPPRLAAPGAADRERIEEQDRRRRERGAS